MQGKDIKVGEDYAVWRYGRSHYSTPVRARVVGTTQVQRGRSWNTKAVGAFQVVIGEDIARPVTMQSRQFAHPWHVQEALDAERAAAEAREAELKVTLWDAYDAAAAAITSSLRLELPEYHAGHRRSNRPPTRFGFTVSDLLDASQRVCSGNGSEVPA